MADHSELVEKLLALGYIPVPTIGKVWIEKHRGQPLRYQDSAPDIELTRAAFRENANAGISVTAPYLRNYDFKILCLDADSENPVTLNRIALIIGKPTPYKTGKRGGTAFVTYDGDILLKTDYEKRRNSKTTKIPWLRESKVFSQDAPAPGQKREGLDFIAKGPYYHSVLPPSIHPETGQPYKYIPVPGTSTILRLEDTDPRDLPRLTSAEFALLTLIFHQNLTAVWEFIGATSPGDFNERMVKATLALHHEFFTKDEILYLALREARRDPPDEQTLREREASIRGAVARLAEKFSVRNPSSPGKVKRIPPDRLYADWLVEQIGADNCASFNGVPYMWNGQHWQCMEETSHRFPLTKSYSEIMTAFPEAGHAATNSALTIFGSRLPQRIPSTSPDLIPFSNGVLHVPTMTLRPEERDDNFTGYINHQYDPTAVCPKWDIYIRDLTLPPADTTTDPFDHLKATGLVEEFLGYGLTRSYDLRYFLLLIGPSSTGKSVLTKVMKGLMPQDWLTEVALEKFSEPNSLRLMANARLNISSETGRGLITKDIDDAILRITSREPIEIKTLYSNRIVVEIPARLIQIGNAIPRFRDAVGALQARMLLVHTTDILPIPEVLAFEKQLLEEASGILNRLVTAYGRLLARGQFIRPDYSVQQAKEVTENANSASVWMSISGVEFTDDPTERQSNSHLYTCYKDWCEPNGFKPFSIVEWGIILASMGYKSVRKRLPGNKYAYVRNLRVPDSHRKYQPEEDY